MDTMSTMVKLATEIDEPHDIGQPTAECQLRPKQGGAEDTGERVYGMVTLTTPSRDKLWRAMLSCRSRPVEKAGYTVKSMRSHVRRVLTRSDDKAEKAEKHTVTLNEEHGEVTSAEEGHDEDWRRRSTLSRTRCQLVKFAMKFHELHIGDDDELPPGQSGAA